MTPAAPAPIVQKPFAPDLRRPVLPVQNVVKCVASWMRCNLTAECQTRTRFGEQPLLRHRTAHWPLARMSLELTGIIGMFTKHHAGALWNCRICDARPGRRELRYCRAVRE